MVRLKKKILNKIFKPKTSVNSCKQTKKKPEIQIFHFLYLKVPSNDQTIDLNSDDLTTNDFNSFTTNAFLDLETKVYGDNWSIPYKRSS